jgi:hypothetical protein
MYRKLYPALLLVAALGVSACDNDLENATQPAPPAPTVTETFEGALNPNNAVTHTFTTAATGTVQAVLTEISPDATMAVGLVLGVWNGFACTTSMSLDAAVQGNALTGTVSGAGTLCVRIHDNGKVAVPLTYKITVTHP